MLLYYRQDYCSSDAIADLKTQFLVDLNLMKDLKG